MLEKKTVFAMYLNANNPNFIPGKLEPHPDGGCRTCQYWGGWTATRPMPNGYYSVTLIGATALCLLTKRRNVNSIAGCDRWQRETGTDDYL